MIRRAKSIVLTCALACLTLAAFAQEGHPLVGTWHGEWSPAPGQTARIVMFLQWDTKNVTGRLNPGPRSAPFQVVALDPEKWTVHFEADVKDKAGQIEHVSADGKLENIGSYNRTITGTWTQGAQKGDFKVTRD